MSGIYIHIPFCKSKCTYCDFFRITDFKKIENYILALKKEIDIRLSKIKNEIFKTIYVGGGTPSILNNEQIEDLFSYLFRYVNIDDVEEFTFECNPDDINVEFVDCLKKIGVNRISFGVQSFNDDVLLKMNRRHNSEQIFNAVELSKSGEIENISIDLIYGFPNMNIDDWKKSIDFFLKLDVDHISAYCLQYEKNSVLTKQVENGILKPKSDDDCNDEFALLSKMLLGEKFEHYEISNFARNNRYSQHNSSYWNGTKYYGFGAAAHSFDGLSRLWNIDDVDEYCKILSSNCWQPNIEKLSPIDLYNEKVMLGLRTMWGVNVDDIKKMDSKFYKYFERVASDKVDVGELIKSNDSYIIPENKIMISNSIISDLFWE